MLAEIKDLLQKINDSILLRCVSVCSAKYCHHHGVHTKAVHNSHHYCTSEKCVKVRKQKRARIQLKFRKLRTISETDVA
jgi:hypothetical protein